MPLYVVECLSCGRSREVLLPSWTSADPLCEYRSFVRDGLCYGVTVRRPSAPAIAFKGSGFFATDYKEGKKD